ncbi:ribokinase [Aquibium microcysteis]|uniref:ribokinase n=1 Tax=Aquibium microcysteis TaxID=675281 RepID=UPI00165CF895|nr:ribokinase [Aquibium microcysteis]
MVIVIGSINLDMITTVGSLPGPGETVRGDRFATAPGGKGANQALAAARAGASVRMIGAVGTDPFASEALALLAAGGIDLSGVKSAAEPTGVALILVGADGENMIAVAPGANNAVTPDDVAGTEFAEGDVLLLQHEIPLETVTAALDAARAAGALSVLNIAPFAAEAVGFVGKADVIVANETEFDMCAAAMSLAGADRAGRMRSFVGRTGRAIVVTLGAEGVLAATVVGDLAVPTIPVKPVDTVGAGDTFCGYLGAGLAQGLPLETALGRAAAAGALACLRHGAQPAIPLRADVEDAVAKAGS